MTLRVLAPSLLLTIFLTTACGAAPPPAAPPPRAEAAPSAGAEAAKTDSAPVAAAAPTPTTTGAPQTKSLKSPHTDIIYSGDLKMLAAEDEIGKTINRIIDLAEARGGHVSARKDLEVLIAVPSPSFRDTMKSIDALGGVTSQSISAQDVSEEMHDLGVRLQNLKATRNRLQTMLDKAGGIPDVLTVEKELERVAQEIDQIEGRLEFLKSRTAFSAIDVHLTAKPKPVQPVVATGPISPSKAKLLDLPVPWVKQVGIDPLLSLSK